MLLFNSLIVTFYFYICLRAFIELQDGIKIRKLLQEKKIVTHFARDTVDLRKHFHYGPQESLPDTRFTLLESRRVALSSHINSRASRFLESLLFL